MQIVHFASSTGCMQMPHPASVDDSKLLFSRKQTAETLSVSLRTVDYLIARGQLSVTRVGKRVLVSRKALEHFAARGATTD